MSQARIRAAFETRLAAWAQAQGLPVVWQNAAASLPHAAHLRAFLLPAQTLCLDLQGKHRGWRGVFQVSVFCPPGTGARQAEGIAQALDELFPAALCMEQSGLIVQITAPVSSSAAIQETDWYCLPVSCRYAADEFV